MTEIHRTLYGDSHGRWLLIDGPTDQISPPHVDVGVPFGGVYRLYSLGPPYDVFTRIYIRHHGNKHPVQQALANMFGVTQQSIARYIDGNVPSLSPESWSLLARAYHHPEVVERAIAEVLGARAEVFGADP